MTDLFHALPRMHRFINKKTFFLRNLASRKRDAAACGNMILCLISTRISILFVVCCVSAIPRAEKANAGNGTLTLAIRDEATDQPVIARTEFYRGAAGTTAGATTKKSSRSGRTREKQMPIRQTVPAGIGVVVDRQLVLELPDGPYRFRMVRGPEYRIIGGTFELEKTSLDEKSVALPRMADLASEGWLSGDCCVTPSQYSLPLRMASEDLHVAAVLGDRPAKPIPRRDADEPIDAMPLWIRSDVSYQDGLIYYGLEDDFHAQANLPNPLDFLIKATSKSDVHVGIENPFAWELPIWLASEKVDGLSILGDWLRLDRRVMKVNDGRSHGTFGLSDPTAVGRFAETIYRHALDAGIRIVPLAGGGNESSQLPVGYNRLYVADVANPSSSDDVADQLVLPENTEAFWSGVWAGRSVATNGPLLRPLVGGKLPGHVFTGRSGQKLRLQPELNLAVRDPVEYLEVIHNNNIHYSARLDEFAAAGGKIPPVMATESGWVIIRVMTLFEDHFRAAVSAPWWIEFNGTQRVSKRSVAFFKDWLGDYESRLKRLPAAELQPFVPYVRAARRFWEAKDAVAQDD